MRPRVRPTHDGTNAAHAHAASAACASAPRAWCYASPSRPVASAASRSSAWASSTAQHAAPASSPPRATGARAAAGGAGAERAHLDTCTCARLPCAPASRGVARPIHFGHADPPRTQLRSELGLCPRLLAPAPVAQDRVARLRRLAVVIRELSPEQWQLDLRGGVDAAVVRGVCTVSGYGVRGVVYRVYSTCHDTIHMHVPCTCAAGMCSCCAGSRDDPTCR